MEKTPIIETIGLWAEDYFRVRRVVTKFVKMGYTQPMIHGLLYATYLQNTRGHFNSNDFKHPDKTQPVVYISQSLVFEELRDAELISQHTYAQYRVSRKGISLLMRFNGMLRGVE